MGGYICIFMREKKSVLKFYLYKSDLKHTPPLNVSLIDPVLFLFVIAGYGV